MLWFLPFFEAHETKKGKRTDERNSHPKTDITNVNYVTRRARFPTGFDFNVNGLPIYHVFFRSALKINQLRHPEEKVRRKTWRNLILI